MSLALTPVKSKVYSFFTCILVVIALETGSFIVGLYLQEKGIFYEPIIASNYDNYLTYRDETLGWPAPSSFGKDRLRDNTGSRIIPAFPNPSKFKECISLYGDSFTWSDEVENEHAWSNILSEFVGCRVSNYGAGGYGTDQGFLRFSKNSGDKSHIIFLNHLSENVIRNVNQFRDFIYSGEGIGFKPRFILDSHGELQLIPLPTLTKLEYVDFFDNPSQYLHHEYFMLGGDGGITALTFPYSISIFRSMNNFRIKAKLSKRPAYASLYKKSHPSMALALTVGILEKFHREVIDQKKIPVITIIPSVHDLFLYMENRTWIYQPLIDELSEKGIEVFNFGEGLLNELENNDPCVLYNHCAGHFNEKGYKLLAKVAYDFLIKKQLLADLPYR